MIHPFRDYLINDCWGKSWTVKDTIERLATYGYYVSVDTVNHVFQKEDDKYHTWLDDVGVEDWGGDEC